MTDPINTANNYTPTENRMKSFDGTELFYRAWRADKSFKKALILFHRGHEHSGRFQDVIEQLDLKDTAIFAWDARGHGRSPGERGYAESFAAMVKDADCFVKHISSQYQIATEDMIIIAHSVAAVTISTWLHDYAPKVRAAVLCSPAFRVKMYVPFAVPSLRILQKFKRGEKSFIKSYVKARMLTHDRKQAHDYDNDPLIAKSIAVNILLEMHDTSTRIIEDAHAITVPTLLLAGNADWVVKLGCQKRFYDNLGSTIKRMKILDGMYHDILHEKDRHLVLNEIRSFVNERFGTDSGQTSLLQAHKYGYTRDEFDRLSEPLGRLSVKNLNFTAQKIAMHTLGRLSKGIRLGLKTGFDSGQTLDYVYENNPRGALYLGKIIDKGYLESIGWRGIRQRKLNLEKLLGYAVEKTRQNGQPVQLLDIATGCGRYMLETIDKMQGDDINALLRDYKRQNLDAGEELARKMGITNVRFELADAFDEQSLAGIEPNPTITVVSGLYELIPDNELLRRSLRGIAAAMNSGGFLVYTGQPWHPQVEMIARTLNNREGAPWVMRRRTQQEMDQLVSEAGFEKVDMEIDKFGIFTVSLAKIAGK